MAKKLVPPIESRRVRAQKPSHARNQIGPRRFDHQMKMIADQTVAMNLPTGLLTDFLQRLQEQVPIFVTKENRLPSGPAIHYMINRAFIFHSQLSQHRPNTPKTNKTRQ